MHEVDTPDDHTTFRTSKYQILPAVLDAMDRTNSRDVLYGIVLAALDGVPKTEALLTSSGQISLGSEDRTGPRDSGEGKEGSQQGKLEIVIHCLQVLADTLDCGYVLLALLFILYMEPRFENLAPAHLKNSNSRPGLFQTQWNHRQA